MSKNQLRWFELV